MSLSTGTRLGAYEILALIGAGGMGEVYRARDTKLGRDVAIKVLPPTLIRDPARVARFRREAQVLAALNHSHIAAIYGLEESDGAQFLVLELVEGETLAHRLAKGSRNKAYGPLPLEDALRVARQVVDALHAAHEKNIVHRDLKPANIAFTADGQVKVLDFGLAKAAELSAGPEDLTNAPTEAPPTETGMILGTAPYMSPEQAKGRATDKRTDVWAFGCVLYEMLAGKRAFSGENLSDTLANVLKSDPDWSALPSNLPAPIRTLIEQCLDKDLGGRIPDISTAQFLLSHHVRLASPSPTRAAASTSTRVPVWLLGAAIACVAIAAAGATWVWMRTRPAPPHTLTRFTISVPENNQFSSAGRHLVAISPDGARLVYVANQGLYLRALDQLDATLLGGTEGAEDPFFSPDGQWIGFWQSGQVKKISTSGGSPMPLCAAVNLYGATWGQDDTILFGQGSAGISRVSASGGTPEVLIRDPGGLAQSPQMLPSGRAVLFTLGRAVSNFDWSRAQVVVQSLDTGTREVLIDGGTDARYLPTGHLVYAAGANLFAVPFDVLALKVAGKPVALVDNLRTASLFTTGAAHFGVSLNGSLVYVPNARPEFAARRSLVWVDRRGQEEAIPAPARAYQFPRLSPDETRVAVDALDQERDIWIWNFARKVLTPFTFNPGIDVQPAWSLDSRRLVWASDSGSGVTNLFWQFADGTGAPERLTESPNNQFSTSFAPNGQFLFTETVADADVMILSLDKEFRKERPPQPLLHERFVEASAQVSPNGRWVAYEATDSGHFEVNVRPFPDVSNGHWRPSVASGGGSQPMWSSDGSELFYRAPTGALMGVRVGSGATWTSSVPVKVLDNRYDLGGDISARRYDVSRDGRRFLVLKDASGSDQTSAPASLIVVENWFEELKRRVPTK